MAATPVNYTGPVDPEYARQDLLKKRLNGTLDALPPSQPGTDEARAWWERQQSMSGMTSDQLQALWRNRALQRASAQPEDVADIALRDAQTGLVTRARRGSRKESMMFGDFNATPPVGGSTLLGG